MGAGFYVHGDLERTKQRRNKRTPFNKELRYHKDECIQKTFPKATETQLEAIRKKLKKENRAERKKLILAFVLAIPVSIILIISIVTFWLNINI